MRCTITLFAVCCFVPVCTFSTQQESAAARHQSPAASQARPEQLFSWLAPPTPARRPLTDEDRQCQPGTCHLEFQAMPLTVEICQDGSFRVQVTREFLPKQTVELAEHHPELVPAIQAMLKASPASQNVRLRIDAEYRFEDQARFRNEQFELYEAWTHAGGQGTP